MVAATLLLACDHTQPFELSDPDPLGPFTEQAIRRLTFNLGDDRDASGRGDVIVFSRRELDRADRDVCLAFLPAEGGTLDRVVCPTLQPDTMLDAWLQPVLSPDGQRVAYVRERARFRGVPPASPTTRELVVAPAAAPDRAAVLLGSSYVIPDGRRATAVRHLDWRDDTTLRFLAVTDTVRASGVRGVLDTVFAGLAIVDLTVADGGLATVPGPPAPRFHTSAPDGGLWVIADDDRSVLLHVAPDGVSQAVATFPGEVLDLARVAAHAVGLARVFVSPQAGVVDMVVRLDVASGAWSPLPFTGTPRAVAGFPDATRLVAEVATSSPASDLWLWAP